MAELIRVNGIEYPFPPEDVTLGEMCDAEQFFGVDFNSGTQTGMRMTAALLWISIRRLDPTVTVDDVRELPPDIFQQLGGDADPPAEKNDSDASGNDDATESSSEPSIESSDGSEPDPNPSGNPDAGFSHFARVTSGT